jgi:hypothetical protein
MLKTGNCQEAAAIAVIPKKRRQPKLKLVESVAAKPSTPKRKRSTAQKAASKPKRTASRQARAVSTSLAAAKLELPPVMLTATAQAAKASEPYWLYSVAPPLPRSAAITLYRKPGLLGLIGSWLRGAATTITGDKRRPSHWQGRRRFAAERAEHTAMDALREENARLRQQLAAIRARDD